MSIQNGGGPAISCAAENGHQRGMLLRDYFAGQAAMGICAGWSQSQHPDARESWAPTRHIGHWAYMVADAMLAARAKETP